MSGRKSRSKGKRGERELAKALTRVFGFRWRRGLTQSRGAIEPDVCPVDDDVLPHMWVECKRGRRFPSVRAALEQARSDAGEHQVPLVCVREDRGEWVVAFRLNDLVQVSHMVVGAWREGEE